MEQLKTDNDPAGAQSRAGEAGANLTVGLGLTRPVRCYFCGDQMFYNEDSRFVPEVRVEANGTDHRDVFYAHATCWDRCLKCDA